MFSLILFLSLAVFASGPKPEPVGSTTGTTLCSVYEQDYASYCEEKLEEAIKGAKYCHLYRAACGESITSPLNENRCTELDTCVVSFRASREASHYSGGPRCGYMWNNEGHCQSVPADGFNCPGMRAPIHTRARRLNLWLASDENLLQTARDIDLTGSRTRQAQQRWNCRQQSRWADLHVKACKRLVETMDEHNCANSRAVVQSQILQHQNKPDPEERWPEEFLQARRFRRGITGSEVIDQPRDENSQKSQAPQETTGNESAAPR